MTARNDDPPGSFGHGIAVGCAICAVLVHVGLVGLSVNFAGMYRDLGGADLPAMTRLTISTPWQLGVPVVGVGLISALVLRRPRGLWIYVAVAVVLAAAAACTYWYPSAPIHALADNLKAG